MKKLIFLLLIPFISFAQTDYTQIAGGRSHGTGAPTNKNNVANLTLYKNKTNGTIYQYQRYSSTSGLWKVCTDSIAIKDFLGSSGGGSGSNGTNGKDATVTVNSVNTVTGAAGTQASVVITDVNPSVSDAALSFMFTIPTGYTGATGKDGVCPSCPPSGGGSFPFTVVIAAAGDDRSAIQAAINKNASDNIPVYLIGNFDISGEITVNKTNYRLTMFMYGAKITASNTNSFTFFKRTMPTDNSDANIYINATMDIYGGELIGNYNQNGFDMGATYMSRYQDVSGQYLNEFITLRFSLNTTVENCKATECKNPFVATIGNWPTANNSNSQCNVTSFNHCKAYMPTNGDIAFNIFAASGCSVTNTVIEGFFCNTGIYFNSNKSTVVRDAVIENVHFECTQGAGVFCKMNYAGGALTINHVFGQYPALFLDIDGGEFVTCEISNVPWWILPASGKFAKRTGDVQLFFERVMLSGPTHIIGSNVMSYIDNGTTTYRTPYYFEDATGKIKINNQR